MKNRFKLFALVIAVATLSLQCSTDKSEAPPMPTTIDQHFKAGTFNYQSRTLNYRECHLQQSQPGNAALVVVLHGQYANGSDNESQLHQDAMIKIWHNLNTSKTKAIMLAPQCPTGYEWDENPQEFSRLTMVELLKAMIDNYVQRQPNIDISRIYVLGYSDAYKPSGAGGVWRALNEYPELFAAGMAVAADPDEAISPSKIAKTPMMLVKNESDVYAVSMAIDSFADMVHDAGGVFVEEIVEVGSREELCREAFTTERLDWVMQHTQK